MDRGRAPRSEQEAPRPQALTGSTRLASPYRDPDATRALPAELVYVAMDPERRVAPARRAIQLALGGSVAAGIAATAGVPAAPSAILLGALALALLQWRRVARPEGIVLRVAAGDLQVLPPGQEPLVSVPLRDLEDVVLDTKSIRKVEPGRDVVPGTHAIHTTVGPEIEVARIGLRVAGRRAVYLTDAYPAHLDSVEWAGKIRSFLRQHGWVPEDERAIDPAADDD